MTVIVERAVPCRHNGVGYNDGAVYARVGRRAGNQYFNRAVRSVVELGFELGVVNFNRSRCRGRVGIRYVVGSFYGVIFSAVKNAVYGRVNRVGRIYRYLFQTIALVEYRH